MRRLAHVLGMLILAVPALAGASFYFSGEGRYAVVRDRLAYRIDDRPADSFQQVMAESSGWVSRKDKPFPGSDVAKVAWARFELPPPPTGSTALVRTLPWEHVEYWIFHDGRLVDHQRAGALVPQSQRTTHVSMTPLLLYSGFASVRANPGGRTTVLARLETTNRYATMDGLAFSVWDAETVRTAELRDGIVQGLFAGVMLFLIVYNLGLWLVTREAAFVYYVAMESGMTFAWMVIFGITSEYFWPEHPWWDYGVLWAATNFGGFGLAQFLRHYLGAQHLGPRVDAALKYLSFWSLAMMPLLAFTRIPYDVAAYLMVYSGPVGMVFVIALIVRALRARHPLARNLLIAMACLGIGIVLYVAGESGLVPNIGLTIHAAQLGSVVAGVVLSLGLGLRMRNLREELANRELVHEREVRALIEEQNRTLEAKVVERTAQLQAEQERSDELLSNILPRAVIEELRAKGESEPRRHEEASILFTDFSGFTQTVSTMPPRRLVQELNDIFRAFDDIMTKHGLEKIKTIGDAYMAAGGLPLDSADHAVRCVRAALELTRFIDERNRTAAMKWGLRVGVHSGAVVAGVVGKNKYAYDVWGDTVNIANRLESSGEVGRVNVSAYTFDLIRDRFECEYRGKIAAKGKGDIDMYFVVRERVAENEPATAD